MLKPKRILYIVSNLGATGPIEQLLYRIKFLNKGNFHIRILTLSEETKDSKLQSFKDCNVKVSSLKLNRLQFPVIGKMMLRKYINKFRPDIIHTTGIRADTALSGIHTLSEHCITVENFAYEDYPAYYGKLLGPLMAYFHVRAISECKYSVCCSESIKQMYGKMIKKKLCVIQNGVDTDCFKPVYDKILKNELRVKLGAPRGKKIFVSVGILSARKDPLTIIKAFKKANKARNAVLIFLGDGELMPQCKNKADESIIFVGRVSNVKEYLQAADFYISASKSEGLPNSVLEAAACGLNLILSDIPQHRELIEDSKEKIENVDFFEIEDTETLSQKIREATKKEIQIFNSELAVHIEKNFSSKAMSKKYENLYLNIFRKNESKSRTAY